MYDIFISYRRKNGFAIAKMISELLKARGVSAFVDLDELRSGTFDDKIIDAIQSSPSFVLILTQGSLDRCGEKDDWLTKEITAAIESGRNIIPVMCDGFEWSNQREKEISDKIKLLSNYTSVIMSYEYVDAMIDKIISYTKNEKPSYIPPAKASEPEPPFNEIDGFFREKINHMDDVIGLDLAFHAGSVWHQDIERLEILQALADAGKKIRVIVNSPEMAELIGKHMRHKMKKYLAYDEAIALWKNLESMYDNVQIRISSIPMMRIYYSFHMADPANNTTRIKFYTYNNERMDTNFSQNFIASDAAYLLYKKEFEYLWEQAQ